MGQSFSRFRRGNVNQGMRGASNAEIKRSERQVMISYNWTDSKKIARKIGNELRNENLSVWFNDDKMKGNINKRMPEGVENADVVLVVLSSNYEKSDNCKLVASRAKELKKRIIPIHVEDGYKASRWLAPLNAATIHHDFRTGSFKENFKKLLDDINKVDSSHIEQDLHSTEDEHCNKLQEMLKKAAKNASETDDSPLIEGKKLDKVAPEIVRDAISRYESGHYHRREDFEKVLRNRSTPAGNIGVEDLLEYSVKEAKREAETCCDDEEVEKQHYIQIHGNIIAVIGQAGIGKTTISKLFTKKVLDESLGKYDYVFYISVRNMNFETRTNLLQFLVESASCDFPNKEWSKDIMSNLLKKLKNNPGVMIILDGLDKAAITDSEAANVGLDAETTAESFIKNLLNGRLLPHAKKFVTSRPDQLYKLHHTCTPHFIAKVLGLSKDSQLKLCQQICGDDATQVEQVMQFLKDHPDIASYCYVPVNCTLTMDAIHKGLTNPVMKQSFVTMTGIMTYTLVNFAKFYTKSKLKDLKKVCKLAYNGIFKDVLVFKNVHTNEVEIDDATLNAFMCTQPSNTSFNIKIFEGGKHFSFSHKIWQEFFCAIYIILFMSSDEFKNHPQKFTEIKWQKVLEFMFGIAKDPVYSQLEETFDVSEETSFVNEKWKALEITALESVPSRKANEDATKQLFQLCVLVHEAQNEVLRDDIAAALPSDIVLSGSLLPSDVTSLYYVLSGRSTNLNMSLEVRLVEESFKILFDKMATSECRNNIKMPKVECRGQKIDDDSAKSLAACLSQIQELSLEECELSASVVEYISSGISKLEKQMELLSLKLNPIDDKGAEYLSSCLKNINQLNIRQCKITDAGVQHLSTAISKFSRPMELLKLSYNPIGDKGAEYLSSCLKNINQLHINSCDITDAGVQHLSTAISKLSRPMELLKLSYNPIGDKGAEYLSSCWKNINQLHIYSCDITDAGVQHLSTATSKLSRPMELLKLSYNRIGNKGAKYSSSCWKKINQLSVYSCETTDAGVHHLSTANSKLSRPEEDIPGTSLSNSDVMSCQSQTEKDERTSDSDDSFNHSVVEDYAPLQTSAIIGIEGGRVDLGECVIEIPPNAIKHYEFFIFTLMYKTDAKEDDGRLKLTPTLKSLPSYTFDEPVTITLPTCHIPATSDVEVTPKTYEGTEWIDLPSVEFEKSHLIKFNTTSVGLNVILGNPKIFSKKHMLFKCCYENVGSEFLIVNWKIVDGDVDVSHEVISTKFYVDVSTSRNIILKMESKNIEFEPCQTKIRSMELSEERNIIQRQFTVFSGKESINWKEQVFTSHVYYADTNELISPIGGFMTKPSVVEEKKS